jgi:hypothetical protein
MAIPDDARCLKCGYRLKMLTGNTCPECGTTFDPHDPKTYHVPGSKGTLVPWQTPTALLLSFIAMSTVNLNGELGWPSLPFTISAVTLSWWGFCRKSESGVWRLLVMAATAIATFLMIHNAVDVLWLVHDTMFP